MVILVLGARGFIGRNVVAALRAGGHDVREAGRPAIDLARDVDPAAWAAHLEGVEVLVNAAGIFREAGAQTFEAIHVRGPLACFEACARRGIPCVQVSALGATEDAPTGFLRSKARADAALLALDVPSIVLQPSLVFGGDGASSAMFLALASMPLVPLPAGGCQRIQPVHVGDVAALVVRVVEAAHFPRARLAVVGRESLALRDYLATLRAAMGLRPARVLSIPRGIASAGAALAGALGGLVDRDALRMLERGNTADAAPMQALLGRPARGAAAFVTDAEREPLRLRAALAWLLPLLRVALAIMWITAGVVSAGIYPVDESLAMLERVGLTGRMAHLALYGAAALDFALGIATLVLPRRRLLWAFQIALVLGYTAIITLALPEQWLHPFGPVVKNLPILAALLALHQLERR